MKLRGRRGNFRRSREGSKLGRIVPLLLLAGGLVAFANRERRERLFASLNARTGRSGAGMATSAGNEASSGQQSEWPWYSNPRPDELAASGESQSNVAPANERIGAVDSTGDAAVLESEAAPLGVPASAPSATTPTEPNTQASSEAGPGVPGSPPSPTTASQPNAPASPGPNIPTIDVGPNVPLDTRGKGDRAGGVMVDVPPSRDTD